MAKLFSVEGGVYRFLSQAYDLMLLNICVLLTSLPIVTLGSSLTTSYQLLRSEEGFSMTGYFRLFRGNLSKGSGMFGLNIVGVGLGICLVLFAPFYFRLVGLVTLAGILLYFQSVYPVLALNCFTLKEVLKLSGYLLLRYTYLVVAAFILFVLSALSLVFLPKLFFVWLFFGVSLPLFGASKLYGVMFNRLEI